MTTPAPDAVRILSVTQRRFSHGNLPGDNGVVVEAETPYTGAAFSQVLPGAFLSDSGEVDLGDIRLPVSVFREWVTEVLAVADAMEDAR